MTDILTAPATDAPALAPDLETSASPVSPTPAKRPVKLKSSVRARGKKNKAKKGEPSLWRYTAGDHGHSVTVFQKRGKRNLYMAWWNSTKGEVDRHSLHHDDQELARQQAREMSDQIRLRTQPIIDGSGEPTLAKLLQLYYMEHGKKLSGYQPGEHDRRRRMWIGFFEQQPRPIIYPRDLDRSLFDTFIVIRRHGDLDVEGISLPEAAPPSTSKTSKREAVVKDGTIDSDLIYLNAALNWATDYRVDGKPLLERKPKVPRCKPQAGTLRQPVAVEDDLEALRPVLDAVDSQKLLRYWLELVNQFGWRVTGLSSVKASEIDFTPGPHSPHGRLLKNGAVDKERRNDSVPLTAAIAALLRELLSFLGLNVGDDKYLFQAPNGGGLKPWSRWHVGRMLVRAEKAADIAHIGGMHAWRRKWHTERKSYPAQDVAVAAGYAAPRSVDRYRHADPETTYLVVTTPTVVIRRATQADKGAGALTDVDRPSMVLAPGTAVSSATAAAPAEAATAGRPVSRAARPRRALRRTQRAEAEAPAAVAKAVGQGRGSAGRSIMPDGTMVESRDERFAANLAVAVAYAREHGHLRPKKHERPGNVNLLMWLKNQEIRIAKCTMPAERRAELEALPAWRDRMAK